MGSLSDLYQNPAIQNGTTSFEIQQAVSDETGTGNLVFANSPNLLGNPTAPTQSLGNNSTRIATTAFVQANKRTDEEIQDLSASLLTSGVHTGVSFTYDDASNRLNATVSSLNTASGNAPSYSARAWGKIDEAGNLLAGGNISSTSRPSTGTYLITFATNMPDTNYSVVATSTEIGTTNRGDNLIIIENVTTSNFNLLSRNNGNGELQNEGGISFVVFR